MRSPLPSIYSVRMSGNMVDVASCLPADMVFAKGLRGTGILGRLRTSLAAGGRLTPDNFVENPMFVGHLHKFIAQHIREDISAVQAAADLREGNLFVIDGRTPEPGGAVPPEDIFGVVVIEGGTMVPGSYTQNPNHRLFTENGFFVLPDPLRSAFNDDVLQTCVNE